MEEQFEIIQYLKIVNKRKGLIVLGVLLCLLTAFAITKYMEPRYEATCKILVAQAQIQATMDNQSAGELYQGVLLSQQLTKTFSEIITGRTLAEKVVEDLNLPMLPDDLMQKVKSVPIRETQLISLTVTDRNPRLAKDLANTYASEFTKYIEETMPRSALMMIKVVEVAVIPYEPISPRPLLNLALAFAVGLLLSTGLAFLLEMLDVTVKEPHELEELVGIASLGRIPKAASPFLLSEGSAAASESFRSIRTNLQYLNFDQSIKTFIVASPNTGEGKTTIAANLAIVFAKAGNNVLLVDCDLRRPRVDKIFDLKTSRGLSNVLIGAADVGSVVLSTEIEGLDIITSGPTPPNPADLLNSDRMNSLITHMETVYDLVILDCPPILAIADTVILAAKADAVLIVSHFGKTKKSEIAAAHDALSKVGARTVGFVINGIPNKQKNSYYYHQPQAEQASHDAKVNQHSCNYVSG